MKSFPAAGRGRRLLLAALALAAAGAGASCRDIEADALYALRLPGPPEERDWAAAVPLRVMVAGGSVHLEDRPTSAQEVDQDTVHRNSASCHHGPAMKNSFPVWLRAYHDRDRLYLRLSWPDLTRDETDRELVRRGGAWRLDGEEGDGISVVFPMENRASFDCSQVCHLDDFSLAGGQFREGARMRFDRDALADLWLWRAEGPGVMDLFLDRRGIHRDLGASDPRARNSLASASGSASGGLAAVVFGPEDGPVADAAGKSLPPSFRPAEGTRLPANLPLSPGGRGSNITGRSRYRRGLWEVTLTRSLSTGDPRDMTFVPGETYYFGLSVLDNTQRDHHIAAGAWKMKVLS